MVKAKTKVEKIKQEKCEKLSVCFSELFKRVITSLVLIPIVLLSLYLGFPFVNVMVLVIGALFCYEWANMVPNKNPCFYAVIYNTVFAIGILFPLPIVFLVALVVSMILIFIKSRDEKNAKFLMLGLIYTALGMGSVLWFAQATGFFITVWLLIAIWATDIGAYFVGTKLRGPKLAPKISPNKTWSGAFGGVLFALLVSFLFIWILGAGEFYKFYLSMAFVVSVLGQVGDLLESAIKRKLNIKDSSNIIPGHGGVFDRLDSLLFVAPVLFFIMKIASLYI